MTAATDRVTGATDPLAGRAVEWPVTTRSIPSGTSTPASSGANTVARCPRAARTRARPMTWPCTPPGLDRL